MIRPRIGIMSFIWSFTMRKLFPLLLVASLAFIGCDKNAEKDQQATAETTTADTTAAETTADSESDENADENTAADGTTTESGAAAADMPSDVEVSPELLDPS